MAALNTNLSNNLIKCSRRLPRGIGQIDSVFSIDSAPLSSAKRANSRCDLDSAVLANLGKPKISKYQTKCYAPFLSDRNIQQSYYSTNANTLSLQSGRYSSANLVKPKTSRMNTTKADEKSQSDLVVVLDMDECLIHSEFLQDASETEKYRQYEADRAAKSRELMDGASSCESFRITLEDGDAVRVNKRPHLDHFLREVSQRYETYIFTAAMEVYASPVLNILDPDGDMFRHRFYRECCTYDESLGVYVKDLGIAFDKNQNKETRDSKIQKLADGIKPFDAKRTVLVDNNPYSFLSNPSNGILVSNFYDNPKDDTLRAVIDLLHELDSVDDVRPVLDSRFGLKHALKEAAGRRYL